MGVFMVRAVKARDKRPHHGANFAFTRDDKWFRHTAPGTEAKPVWESAREEAKKILPG